MSSKNNNDDDKKKKKKAGDNDDESKIEMRTLSSDNNNNHRNAKSTSNKKMLQQAPGFLKGLKKYRWFIIVVCFIIFVVIVALVINSGVQAEVVSITKAEHGAVATEDVRCSDIGVQMLQNGGSAVDAAIASALCLGVVHNFASGIGGGGFMLVYNTPTRTSTLFDFREEAPAASNPAVFQANPNDAVSTGKAIAIPGEIRGFEMAHKKYGILPWKSLFQPAIDLARNGYEVTSYIEGKLEGMEGVITSNPLWSAIFAPSGTLVQTGDTVKNEALANTLEAIATDGPDAFYTGTIADTIVSEVLENKGNITLQDLLAYKAKERRPVSGYYHGKKVITGGPPTSGPVLLCILNIIERYQLYKEGLTTDTYQWMTEAFKFAFAQRSYLGDPDFVNITTDLSRMMSKDWASLVRRNISLTETFPSAYYGGNYQVPPSPGTTHISVLDPRGQAAALTSTINLEWGSQIMSSLGLIYNNEMDDFSIKGSENNFGLPPSPANFIAPYKRPLSSSSPTIVLQDDYVDLVVGASGGTRIITATALTIVNNLDMGKDILASIQQARIHHQLYPNQLQVEYDFSTSIRRALQTIGHEIDWLPEGYYNSAVQGVNNGTDGYIYAAADPRKEGQAAGF